MLNHGHVLSNWLVCWWCLLNFVRTTTNEWNEFDLTELKDKLGNVRLRSSLFLSADHFVMVFSRHMSLATSSTLKNDAVKNQKRLPHFLRKIVTPWRWTYAEIAFAYNSVLLNLFHKIIFELLTPGFVVNSAFWLTLRNKKQQHHLACLITSHHISRLLCFVP